MKELSPTRWAIDISRILNAALGADRFPINVVEIAKEISHKKYPTDPITMVAGERLPNFDGALCKARSGSKGWGIIYNQAISSPGRINFTLAHEFGHYLIHRQAFPDGLRCSSQDMVRWDSEYRQVERQANEFAANLLMPRDDYRRQIDPKDSVNLDQLGQCAARYEVSLIAATLRWLDFTQRRAVLVVSTEGFILWARSSDRAWKSGAFFRTSGVPVPVPAQSLAARRPDGGSARNGIDLDPGTWFKVEGCRETAIYSDQYDFTISLLQLSNDSHFVSAPSSESEEPEEDLADRIRRIHGLS